MSSDWLFPPKDTKLMPETFIKQGKKSKYVEIESIHGHDGFLIEDEKMTTPIKEFLASIE